MAATHFIYCGPSVICIIATQLYESEPLLYHISFHSFILSLYLQWNKMSQRQLNGWNNIIGQRKGLAYLVVLYNHFSSNQNVYSLTYRWIFMALFAMETGGHCETSPCCLLIGQYPHHTTLALPSSSISMVKKNAMESVIVFLCRPHPKGAIYLCTLGFCGGGQSCMQCTASFPVSTRQACWNSLSIICTSKWSQEASVILIMHEL